MKKRYEESRVWIGLLVMVAVAAIIGMSGCQGTRQAYQSAETLDAYAYVVTAHYAAVLAEAADIAENPMTPDSARQRLRAADLKAAPLVEQLRPLAEAYGAVRSAENELALQAALNDAVLALNELIQLVRGLK